MRVLILSDSTWPFGLTAALVQDPLVTHLEVSDDFEREADADVAVISAPRASKTVAADWHSGTCIRVVVAQDATAGERIRLLQGGADVVLHGDVLADEIVAQVRAIARRRNPLNAGVVRTPRSTDKITLEMDCRHAVVLGRRVTLTLLEAKLLHAFMNRPGVVLDRRALMTTVWGSPFGAPSTVSAHIRRLRVKIEPDPSNPVFIHTVWGGGYLYRPDGR